MSTCCMSEMCTIGTSNSGTGDVFWSLSEPSSLEFPKYMLTCRSNSLLEILPDLNVNGI
jgi:hypothetical protein